MGLNDELLRLHENIRYYSLGTFNNIPSEPGVYAWFYPLRIKNRELKEFIDEISTIFNFNCDESGEYKEYDEFKMGWRRYSLKTGFKELKEDESFLNRWKELYNNAATKGDYNDIEELKKIIFISSIFMPPLYIGKATDLSTRCQQHILGTTSKINNFHHRFRTYTKCNNMSCRNVEELIFACVSTKQFNLNNKKYEELVESILMKLVKPAFSIK